MIAVLFALAMSAEPKDCKEDRACFEAAAKKCEPAIYAVRAAQAAPGFASSVAVFSYTITGPANGGCGFERVIRIESTHMAPEMAAMVFPDAGPNELAALEREVIRNAEKEPSSHYRCNLPPGELAEWMRLEPPNRAAAPTDHFAKCKPADCGKQPKLAAGCAYTECTGHGWRFKCGADECGLLMPDHYADSAVITCVVDSGGNFALDVKDVPKKKK